MVRGQRLDGRYRVFEQTGPRTGRYVLKSVSGTVLSFATYDKPITVLLLTDEGDKVILKVNVNKVR